MGEEYLDAFVPHLAGDAGGVAGLADGSVEKYVGRADPLGAEAIRRRTAWR
ncbi:MAG: hypothetical protein PHG96_07635 [Kiritimatiellae bacterium]|nr:hypothetical protein [Kiritimatiellia bacterium]MDD3545212.1 hypothetical protein [Kiritimatiellia bacterium]MDD4025026.1 hypothetical protein [Kiritimatiellia bacterium]MDD4623509.1 hypothetical protein [Kiritimatiellia bacterium]